MKDSQAIARAICKYANGNKKKFIWTEDTIYCKLRGCKCEGCKFEKISNLATGKQGGCRLKKRVIQLVQQIGKPEGIPEPSAMNSISELKYLNNKYSIEELAQIYKKPVIKIKKMLEKI